ncbi:hypothetical protein PM082_000770 [Marasmius tenuissimus]|nr:hypothetical protein PM082_000770 [Marasmius tenuissimus]
METISSDAPLQSVVTCDHCKHRFVVPNLNQIVPLPTNAVRSDYVPQDEQALQAMEQLETDKKTIRLYNAEITRLQTALGKLVEGKNKVERRMKERRAMVSAIRRLPGEILSEIFLRCISPGEYSFSADHTGVRARTLNISQVCSRWRTIINAIPKLWSSLHIDLYEIKHNISSIIDLYINRSREHPLHVYLADELDKSEGILSFDRYFLEIRFGKRGLEAVDCLLGAIERFEELEINMSGELIDSIIGLETPGLSDVGVDFCRLKVFGTARSLFGLGGDNFFWKSICEAQKLTHLVVRGRLNRELLQSLPHITSVDLRGVPFLDIALNVLQYTPSLERLSAISVAHHLLPQELPPTIIAKSLRHLSLDGPIVEEIAKLFSVLVLPSMTSLEIVSHSRPDTPHSTQPILDVLQRSSCSLQELVLRLPLHLPDLLRVIRSCPSLTYLEILLPAMPEAQEEITEFLSQLGVHESMAVLAPALSRLHIYTSDALSWDVGVAGRLVETLDSRARYSGLKTVQLSFHHTDSPQNPHRCNPACRLYVNPVFKESIRGLRVKGMDCVVQHQSHFFPEHPPDEYQRLRLIP